MRYRSTHNLAWLMLGSVCVALSVTSHAQSVVDGMPTIEGMEATAEESAAWAAVDAEQTIRGRELAEAVLKKHPNSFVGHLALGRALHFGEGNLPLAELHVEQARRLFESRYGSTPDPSSPWRWHVELLKELTYLHADLEHHEIRLKYIKQYNELYEPDMEGERAWPLMKLGRYNEARKTAREAAKSDRYFQRNVALNALCAIEFEAGNDGASYQACKAAVDAAVEQGLPVSSVDLANLAEAARSMFRLDEAERVDLASTEAALSWYGNPWMELAELYTREGRFMEALSALKEIPGYRAQRPPHVRDSDRNETRRALTAFLLTVGRPGDALAITDRALQTPDRRGHNSRDPGQDEVVMALLDRSARQMSAELVLEQAAGEPFYMWPLAWLKATWLRINGSRSGALAARLLSEKDRLVGVFRIGTAHAAVIQPWLAGDIIDIVGPEIARAAITRSRRRDKRPGANSYYDAFEAEARLLAGDGEGAVKVGTRAIANLNPAEALLRARVQAVVAEAVRRGGDDDRAVALYEAAMQSDPGVLRRTGWPLPVRFESSGGRVGADVAESLAWSPRLTTASIGLTVRIQANAGGGSACLVGTAGNVLGCGEAKPKANEDVATLVRKLVASFHEHVFAPHMDLSQADINSLDGSNTVDRSVLKTLLDQ